MRRQNGEMRMSDTARRLFLATRPMFFPASAVPVVVGTTWGVSTEQPLDVSVFLAALLGMLCLHAGANVINDIGDEINGCDRLNEERISPFTGGSRFLQEGGLRIASMTMLGIALLIGAAAVGLTLAAAKGWMVLALGFIGAVLGITYSLPPFSLAGRGLGEAAVAVAFGLPVAACSWLQQGEFSINGVLAASAVGCWTAAILIANEVPDRRADAMAGKRTLVVRLGIPGSLRLYQGVHAVALLFQIALFTNAGLPVWTTLVPATLAVIAIAVAPKLTGPRDSVLTVIRMTLAVHLIGGLWLSIAGMLATSTAPVSPGFI